MLTARQLTHNAIFPEEYENSSTVRFWLNEFCEELLEQVVAIVEGEAEFIRQMFVNKSATHPMDGVWVVSFCFSNEFGESLVVYEVIVNN